MSVEHLWAEWRSDYVRGVIDERAQAIDRAVDVAAGNSLFERILDADADDSELGIVGVTDHCWVVLNRFPYTTGHLMVLPKRAEPLLSGLSDQEHSELWDLVRDATIALREGLGCEGINVGVNEGRPAGGSQSDHLHVHCVPRWTGDTNFLPIAAGVRVHSVGLPQAYDKLVEMWPTTSPLRRRRPSDASGATGAGSTAIGAPS